MNSIQERDFQTQANNITEDNPKKDVDLIYEVEDYSNEEERSLNKKSIQFEKKKPKKSKVKKILAYIFGVIGVLLLLYIIFNVICSIYEHHKVNSYNYGTTINVNGHKMVVDIKGEHNEPTIVFLTGFITPSPVINYRPLSDLLSKTYKFIVIEPFGYGLSDIVDEERTIENVTAELHNCIEQLNIKNYYLMAHSLGGVYSLYYTNKYPNEVIGFVGFDTIAPKIASFDKQGNKDSLAKGARNAYWFNFFGLNRMMSLFNKSNLILHLSKRCKYTDEEITMFRNIELSKSINKNIVSEGDNTVRDLEVIDDMKFPKNMTLLHILSTQNTDDVSNFKQCHIDVGSESLSNEVIILEGKHYDFLFIHNDEITSKLSTFIK